MRCSDIIEVCIEARRHVGGMFGVNKRYGNLKIIVPTSFADNALRFSIDA